VYGEGQSLKNPYTGILSIFSNLMKQNLPVNIFEDGLESRDFIHVSDVVKAIKCSLNLPKTKFDVFNVGTGTPSSVYKIAQLLKNNLGSISKINITGDFRLGDIRHCYADVSKAENILGFKSSKPIEEGLNQFCKWVINQPVVLDRSNIAQEELTKVGLGSLTKN
jgi:dTDP-L-rhamnose 4-epimerase